VADALKLIRARLVGWRSSAGRSIPESRVAIEVLEELEREIADAKPARVVDAWTNSFDLKTLADKGIDRLRIYATKREAEGDCDYNGWKPCRIRILMWHPGEEPGDAEES
jgi:hypothetical protein